MLRSRHTRPQVVALSPAILWLRDVSAQHCAALLAALQGKMDQLAVQAILTHPPTPPENKPFHKPPRNPHSLEACRLTFHSPGAISAHHNSLDAQTFGQYQGVQNPVPISNHCPWKMELNKFPLDGVATVPPLSDEWLAAPGNTLPSWMHALALPKARRDRKTSRYNYRQ